MVIFPELSSDTLKKISGDRPYGIAEGKNLQ